MKDEQKEETGEIRQIDRFGSNQGKINQTKLKKRLMKSSISYHNCSDDRKRKKIFKALVTPPHNSSNFTFYFSFASPLALITLSDQTFSKHNSVSILYSHQLNNSPAFSTRVYVYVCNIIHQHSNTAIQQYSNTSTHQHINTSTHQINTSTHHHINTTHQINTSSHQHHHIKLTHQHIITSFQNLSKLLKKKKLNLI